MLESWSIHPSYVPPERRVVTVGWNRENRPIYKRGSQVVSDYWLKHHKESQDRERNNRWKWTEYAEYLLSGRGGVKADVRSAIMAMDGYGDRKLANRLRKLAEKI